MFTMKGTTRSKYEYLLQKTGYRFDVVVKDVNLLLLVSIQD